MAPDKTVSVSALRHLADVMADDIRFGGKCVAKVLAAAEILEKMRTCYTEHNSQYHCGFRGARWIKP